MRSIGIGCLVAWSMLLASPAHATFAEDPVEAFSAVGSLHRGEGPLCRITLLDHQHALTAGHCVRGPYDSNPLEGLFVRWSDGARTEVEDVALVPGFWYEGYSHASWDVLANDVAVVRLSQPVPVDPVNLFRVDAQNGIVWLPKEKEDGWEPCPFGPVEGRPALLWIGCSRSPGQSGSPVLSLSDGRVDAVGIVVAQAPQGGLFAHKVGPILDRLLWDKAEERSQR